VAGRSFDGKRPDGPRRKNVGHFFMAIDPAKFREGDDFGNELDGLMDTMRATPPTDPAQPVQMAGDAEYAEYARRSREGIPVTDTLLNEMREVCKASGAEFILQ
jgi:LDH2 family malate/lactate/ureidoglycolate dehydrogenase